MIILNNAVLSEDIKERHFVCDLNACKGACCMEGDLGASLEEDECSKLDGIIEMVKPYMSKNGLVALEKQGAWILDEEGDYSTTTVDNKECTFAVYDEKKVLKCSIEQACLNDKTSWKKPISCHLYPIRVTKHGHYDALNYDQWDICDPACTLGDKLKIPIYKFLEEPLIRKYGQKWYAQLVEEIER